MQTTFLNNAGALGTFSSCPQSVGNLLRVAGGKSFTDTLFAMQTMTSNSFPSENTTWNPTDLLRLLPNYTPQSVVEPEIFSDNSDYAKHLQTKFGMQVTVKNFSKDQKSMDALGRSMGGNDLVIAPKILEEMATDRDKAQYYEKKIQYWFDNIPKWKAESAAMGLTYEPCGVAIHEDGTVYYIGGCTETPERKAQIEAAQKAKREKKFKRRQEQQQYIQQLTQQKQTTAMAENWAQLPSPASIIVTIKKFIPDGAIAITTKKDGKIVEKTKKNLHLVPVTPTTESSVRTEPMQDIFALPMT